MTHAIPYPKMIDKKEIEIPLSMYHIAFSLMLLICYHITDPTHERKVERKHEGILIYNSS